MASPGCVAWMAHRPPASNVTVVPDTEQVVAVVDAKLTGSPDDAVAETVKGGVLIGLLDNAANVIVCASFVIWNAWLTGVAAA
jgi:hypothetical protein